MKILAYVVFAFVISFNVHADQRYEVLIDAGSSGSRISLYQVYYNDNEVPYLNLLIQKSITPGLSSFSKNPKESIPYIESLLEQTKETLTNFAIHNNQVSLYIFATAGMRNLSEQDQNAIYSVLRDHFATRGYAKYEIRTIPGRDEAI